MAKIIHQEVSRFLQSYAAIPAEEIEDFLSQSNIKEYKKGENFVIAGGSAKVVGFVHKGLFRAYCVSEQGQTYIRNFCSQGYFVGSYASALRNAPADMTIEALEDSTVLTVEFSVFNAFFKKSAPWQELGRKVAEYHYIERETKEYRLLTCSALERYQLFLKENPHLEGRISQANIASYIGVTPEALSRVLKSVK